MLARERLQWMHQEWRHRQTSVSRGTSARLGTSSFCPGCPPRLPDVEGPNRPALSSSPSSKLATATVTCLRLLLCASLAAGLDLVCNRCCCSCVQSGLH